MPKEDLHTFKQLLMDKPDGNCVFESNKTILASDLATIAGTRSGGFIIAFFRVLLNYFNRRTPGHVHFC